MLKICYTSSSLALWILLEIYILTEKSNVIVMFFTFSLQIYFDELDLCGSLDAWL